MANKDNMKCNQPKSSDRDGKKKMVKACANGKEKLIHYGADGYKHNYSKEAKKSFRARHGCDEANDKLSAKHWACKDLWPKNKNNFNEGGIVEEQCDCPSCKAKGGLIKGPEVTKGDSIKNDIVKVNLSAGELVIPKSVVEKGLEAINKFAKEELSRENMNKGGIVEDNSTDDLGFVPDNELGFVSDEEMMALNPDKSLGEIPTNFISKSESALKGTQQGLTLGFADELQGAGDVVLDNAMSFLNRFSGGLTPKSPAQVNEELKAQGITGDGLESDIKDIYTKKRDQARSEYQQAEEANPGSYIGGNITGGVLLPGAMLGSGKKVADVALNSARLGALAGVGSTDADLTRMSEEDVKQAIEDVGQGGAIGAAGGLIGQGIAKGASKLTNKDGYLADLLNSFLAGKQGKNLVTETGRKKLADEIVQEAAPLSNKITDEIKDLASQKRNILDADTQKIDIGDLEAQLNKQLDNRPAALTAEGQGAVKSIQEPFINAKKLYSTPEGTMMSPKEIDNLRKTLGRLGYEKDLKDDEIIGLSKMLSGKASEFLPDNVKQLNSKMSPLIKAQELLNVEGGSIVDELGNTKSISSMIDRLEKEGLQGSLTRNKLDEAMNLLKKSNPELGNEIGDKLGDLAKKYDISKKLSKFDLNLQSPIRSALGAPEVGANILGQGINKLNKIPLVNNVGTVIKRAGNISETSNASDVNNAQPLATQTKNLYDMNDNDLRNTVNQTFGNDSMYKDDIKVLNESIDQKNSQRKNSILFKLLQNPGFRSKLNGE